MKIKCLDFVIETSIPLLSSGSFFDTHIGNFSSFKYTEVTNAEIAICLYRPPTTGILLVKVVLFKVKANEKLTILLHNASLNDLQSPPEFSPRLLHI